MTDKGFLLVMAQPTAAMEEEFNAWYDTEHVPERLAVPGFESAARYVATSAIRRYLALYDLERPEVLDSPAYGKVSGDNFSPWTRRVTGRSRVSRSAGRQAYPGQSLTRPCVRLLVIRFRAVPLAAETALVTGLRETFEPRAEVIQARLFVAPLDGDKADMFGVIECRGPTSDAFDPAPFGGHADAIDLIETFAPY